MGVDGEFLAKNPNDIHFVSSPVQDFISIRGFLVHNSSVSGDSTKTMLDGQYSKIEWQKMARASCAKVVLFNFGINDTLVVSETEYAENLKKIIAISRHNGRDVILQTPNPSRLPNVPHYAEIMRKIAREKGVSVIDTQEYLVSTIPKAQLTQIIPDGIHPNQNGYELIGRYMNTRLNEILLDRKIVARLPMESLRQILEGASSRGIPDPQSVSWRIR